MITAAMEKWDLIREICANLAHIESTAFLGWYDVCQLV